MIESIRRKMPEGRITELQHYPTLYRQRKGKLLAVREIRIGADSFDLMRLAVPSEEHRRLKRDHVIQLVFVGEGHIPFYTLIDYEGWRMEYYRARIGEVFAVEVV